MSKIEITRTYAYVSADACFVAAKEALARVDFEIWKTRPIGWLVMAHLQTAEGKINATVAVRPGTGADLTFSLVGETLAEDDLRSIAEEALTFLDDSLVEDP